MSTDIPNLFETALSLPESERASLVHVLLHSLQPPGVLGEDSSQLDDELEKRLAKYDAGETQASDLASIESRIKRAIEKRIPS